MKLHVFLTLLFLLISLHANDLEDVKKSGELRHLGIPYANFVRGANDGLDVEMIQGFAKYLNVTYKYIPTTWSHALSDLSGNHVKYGEKGVEILAPTQIKGDLIANGMTVLAWRQEVVAFSQPTFPSGVWLVARSDSTLKPILPSGSIESDISSVKTNLSGLQVLSLANTCLDPKLYEMEKTEAIVVMQPKDRKLNEMIPAILNKDAESTLLDVPDALIGLEKWPGEVKVIGPISKPQIMAVAFRQNNPELRKAFNAYFQKIWDDGSYFKLVEKYYPDVFHYFPEFFKP